jgi:tRNA threonylcarbamoyladenosine biosynthesis protein TsaB
MRLLLIHTCGLHGSVALADTASDPPILATAALPPRTFSEALMPAIRHILAAAAWSPQDLEAVGVVDGPGSFTGVRTGLSVAKGLCESLAIPLAGISRLALLARAVGSQGTVHALLDAGRNEFYHGIFHDGVPGPETLLSADQLLDQLPGGTIVSCEEKVQTALASLHLATVQVEEPSAADALTLALERLATASDGVFADANYLRRTDGEIFAKPSSPKPTP